MASILTSLNKEVVCFAIRLPTVLFTFAYVDIITYRVKNVFSNFHMDNQALMQLAKQIMGGAASISQRYQQWGEKLNTNNAQAFAQITGRSPEEYSKMMEDSQNAAMMIGSVQPVSKGFNYIAGLGNQGIKTYMQPERLNQLDRAMEILRSKKISNNEYQLARDIIDEMADFTTPHKVVDKINKSTPLDKDPAYYRKIGDWMIKNVKEAKDTFNLPNLLPGMRK